VLSSKFTSQVFVARFGQKPLAAPQSKAGKNVRPLRIHIHAAGGGAKKWHASSLTADPQKTFANGRNRKRASRVELSLIEGGLKPNWRAANCPGRETGPI